MFEVKKTEVLVLINDPEKFVCDICFNLLGRTDFDGESYPVAVKVYIKGPEGEHIHQNKWRMVCTSGNCADVAVAEFDVMLGRVVSG